LPKLAESGAIQIEMANKLQNGLKKASSNGIISRDATLFGFEIPNAPGKFFYVWFDAPVGLYGEL